VGDCDFARSDTSSAARHCVEPFKTKTPDESGVDVLVAQVGVEPTRRVNDDGF
jgi:hypothetical protein